MPVHTEEGSDVSPVASQPPPLFVAQSDPRRTQSHPPARAIFPWIWDLDLGEVEPADREETEATFGLLSRFIADPALDIGNNLECFEPLFLKSPKLAHLVDWFDGILAGTRFHPRLWEHVI